MSETKYPPGWDESRVNRVLEHYETQTDEEAVAEDEDVAETGANLSLGGQRQEGEANKLRQELREFHGPW